MIEPNWLYELYSQDKMTLYDLSRKRRLDKKHIQIEDRERSPQLNNAVKEGMVEAENDSTKQKPVPAPTKTNGVSACAGTKEEGSSGPVKSEKKERGAETVHTIV